MTVPAAMVELMWRYFGFGATPDYSGTLDVFSRDPYRPVREALASRWQVADLTDYNSDLSFVYVLLDQPERLTVRFSAVGPYAVVLSNGNRVVSGEGDIYDVIGAAGFSLVSRDVLELPVPNWEPEVSGSVYEFLFEFDQGIPWIS